MHGLLAECEREPEGFIWRTAEEIARECSIPTAFRAYRTVMLKEK